MPRGLERSKSAIRSRRKTHFETTSDQKHQITLVVLGDEQVGKSAIVSQFLWNGFVVEYTPTVEEFNWIEYEFGDDRMLLLQVIDSGGSHDFLAMRHLYIQTGDAFLVVFSVDDPNSFEEAKTIIREIKDTKQESGEIIPILLVANKIDLYENETQWKVQGASEYALTGSVPMVSISAKDHSLVVGAVTKCLEALRGDSRIKADELRKRRQSMPAVRGSGVDPRDIEKLKHKDKCSIQ